MSGPEKKAEGDIPVLEARGRTIPEAWERSVLRLWEEGVRVRTEYDREGDEPSRDSTMVIVVERPLDEPRIHLAFPGGIEDLEKYRQEVLFGVHDGWIRPEEGKWTYTYHQRLSAYAPVDDLSSTSKRGPFKAIDQIQYIIDKLASSPHSRRAQGITWMPTADPATDDPPCLQRIWCRLIPVGDIGTGSGQSADGSRDGSRQMAVGTIEHRRPSPSAGSRLPSRPRRTGPRFPSPPRRGDLRSHSVPFAVCRLPRSSVSPICRLKCTRAAFRRPEGLSRPRPRSASVALRTPAIR